MNITFWRSAAERAIKSAAQALILVVGAAQFDWVHADWKSLGLSAASAFGLSVLTSIASIPYGTNGTASLVGILSATKPQESTVAPAASTDSSVPVSTQDSSSALLFDPVDSSTVK